MNEIRILDVRIDNLTMKETVNKVEKEYILNRKPLHLMGVNADKLNLCCTDNKIKEIVNKSEIINADGASVVLAGRYLNYNIPERVAGIDLMQELLNLSNNRGYSVYFLGAKQEILDDMIDIFKDKYKNLIILGSRNGYFSDEELSGIENDLNNLKPNIVFVGITSPRKEYIVQRFLDNGLNSVFMGVGGSFDVLSGHIKRAPFWMQKSNLEWLFRVVNEPKRLFKRYFIGNVQFINRIIKEKKNKKNV